MKDKGGGNSGNTKQKTKQKAANIFQGRLMYITGWLPDVLPDFKEEKKLLQVLLNSLEAANILNQMPPFTEGTAPVSSMERSESSLKMYDKICDVFFNLSLCTLSMIQCVVGSVGTQKVLYSHLARKVN